jgi:hypothetical protein
VKEPISEMMVGTKRGREAKETLLCCVVLVSGKIGSVFLLSLS